MNNSKLQIGGGVNAQSLINYLKENIKNAIAQEGNIYKIRCNSGVIEIDTATDKFNVIGVNVERRGILDLRKIENHSVVMFLIKLFSKGYSPGCITLEKKWQTGHDPIWLDIMLKDPETQDIYMIDVKNQDEFKKYSQPANESKVKQLCSYAMQEKRTKIASFYAYDFTNDTDRYATIYCEELRSQSLNTDDFYARWNKIFEYNDWVVDNDIFSIRREIIKFATLRQITEPDTKVMFSQFETILRLNSVSDKPTAFMRMINLFLAKLADEIGEDKDFRIQDNNGNNIRCNGLKFQHILGETNESFMKRLNDLYKEGMKSYLRKEVIDYSDEDIERILSLSISDNKQMKDVLDDLRLKKDITFSFIEVYDEKTFNENTLIVKDIVSLIEKYRLKYGTKHQFLGDFFEQLLNTSMKQEAGQFFTPYPIVDFMINVINIDKTIERNITNRERDFIPLAIDYACGAGHFLISYMNKVQRCIDNIFIDSLTSEQKRMLSGYRSNPYSWVANHVVGIEKDYRLAKTTKIATFLNGDGEAEIIAGDGINKFHCDEYRNTIVASQNNTNEIFDYVISNPPYSVEGFMFNLIRNGINKGDSTFDMLNEYTFNEKSTEIEILFVERAYQLLKNGGICAIVLPQSILSGGKYEKMRNFLLQNFKILSILLTADITFSGTTTSPVILFLRKENVTDFNYDILCIQSPKYTTPNGAKLRTKEEKFLGYKFSSNRAKSGMAKIEKSILEAIEPIVQEFNLTNDCTIPTEHADYVRVINLSNIMLNVADNYCGDIYPKHIKVAGVPLSKVCKINEWTEGDFETLPKQYLEIGDIQTQTPSKAKKTTRFCKSGDILVSSLTPRATQIVVAKGDFMISNAIFVLSSFPNEDMRDKTLIALKSKDALSQMNSLLDGFKATYAKISEKNLFNNVYINI